MSPVPASETPKSSAQKTKNLVSFIRWLWSGLGAFAASLVAIAGACAIIWIFAEPLWTKLVRPWTQPPTIHISAFTASGSDAPLDAQVAIWGNVKFDGHGKPFNAAGSGPNTFTFEDLTPEEARAGYVNVRFTPPLVGEPVVTLASEGLHFAQLHDVSKDGFSVIHYSNVPGNANGQANHVGYRAAIPFSFIAVASNPDYETMP
ncbi:MAG: hypothetical protein AAF086_01065 [Planctomycetota bacterium]